MKSAIRPGMKKRLLRTSSWESFYLVVICVISLDFGRSVKQKIVRSKVTSPIRELI